jgi:hypothetical protein
MTVQSEDQQAGAAVMAALGMALPGRALVVAPPVAGKAWSGIVANASQSIVFVNNVSAACRLCSRGQPAIAVMGVSKGKMEKWLRRQGAKVHMRPNMN